MSERILVFIPCYNCENQISRVLHQFTPDVISRIEEILVLDNGSTDRTLEVARCTIHELPPGTRVKVAKNQENYNLGGSHKAAFSYASAEGFTHVLVLHGDDQGSIADIIPLLDSGMHLRYDACLGARFMSGSRLVGYSIVRIIGNLIFNQLFSFATATRVRDLGSGLNIFGPKIIHNTKIFRYSDDLRFNIYLLLGMIDCGNCFEFFPISWREDDQISNVKMVSQASRTLSILKEYMFSRQKFRAVDHRDSVRDAYIFDVVSSSENFALKKA